MSACKHCGKPIPAGRKPRKFCPPPAGCKQAWHRENTHPGTVVGVRQLRTGAWSVTVHYPNLPDIGIGSRVLLEKDSPSASDPSAAVRDDERSK